MLNCGAKSRSHRIVHSIPNIKSNSLNICPYCLDPPGPPKNLHHTDADKTEVWLEWEWPDRTGGSEITGFIIEYQKENEVDWVPYKTVSSTHVHVTGLGEGNTYRFRAMAQNAIGISRPDTSVPVTCQEKTCKTS